MKKGIYESIDDSTHKVSAFCKRLQPVGRILEEEGWYVWCSSPIYGQEGKVIGMQERYITPSLTNDLVCTCSQEMAYIGQSL